MDRINELIRILLNADTFHSDNEFALIQDNQTRAKLVALLTDTKTKKEIESENSDKIDKALDSLCDAVAGKKE